MCVLFTLWIGCRKEPAGNDLTALTGGDSSGSTPTASGSAGITEDAPAPAAPAKAKPPLTPDEMRRYVSFYVASPSAPGAVNDADSKSGLSAEAMTFAKRYVRIAKDWNPLSDRLKTAFEALGPRQKQADESSLPKKRRVRSEEEEDDPNDGLIGGLTGAAGAYSNQVQGALQALGDSRTHDAADNEIQRMSPEEHALYRIVEIGLFDAGLISRCTAEFVNYWIRERMSRADPLASLAIVGVLRGKRPHPIHGASKSESNLVSSSDDLLAPESATLDRMLEHPEMTIRTAAARWITEHESVRVKDEWIPMLVLLGQTPTVDGAIEARDALRRSPVPALAALMTFLQGPGGHGEYARFGRSLLEFVGSLPDELVGTAEPLLSSPDPDIAGLARLVCLKAGRPLEGGLDPIFETIRKENGASMLGSSVGKKQLLALGDRLVGYKDALTKACDDRYLVDTVMEAVVASDQTLHAMLVDIPPIVERTRTPMCGVWYMNLMKKLAEKGSSVAESRAAIEAAALKNPQLAQVVKMQQQIEAMKRLTEGLGAKPKRDKEDDDPEDR